MWWAKMDDLIFDSCYKWVFPSSLNPRGAWSANCNPVVFLWNCPSCGAVTPTGLFSKPRFTKVQDANFVTGSIQRHFSDHLRTSPTHTDRDNCTLLRTKSLRITTFVGVSTVGGELVCKTVAVWHNYGGMDEQGLVWMAPNFTYNRTECVSVCVCVYGCVCVSDFTMLPLERSSL